MSLGSQVSCGLRDTRHVCAGHPPVPATERHGGARDAVGEGRGVNRVANVVATNKAESVPGHQHDPPERSHRPRVASRSLGVKGTGGRLTYVSKSGARNIANLS